MKKNLFIFICVIAAVFCVFSIYVFSPVQDPSIQSDVYATTDFLRLHIRANSNTISDQQTKYAVRDEVLSMVTLATKDCQTAEEACVAVRNAADEIIAIAANVSGSDVSLEITTEQFPTREYDGVILPAGEYTAIVINLGSGEGDNWWCVAFPPLCYIDGEEVEGDEIILKSKIAEIVDKYLKDC